MMRSIRQILAASLLGLLVLGGACDDDNSGDTGGGTPATPGASGEFPVTLERADGKDLTLEAAPQRIAALSPGHVEMLFAIGAGDQVIAVEQNADYPPEAAAMEIKLSAFEPSAEAIAAVDPDLVIISNDLDGIVAALDNLGIPVLFDDIDTRITTIEEVFESIEEMGRATGHADEAETLVDGLQERVDAVVEDAAGLDGPTIYHELDVTGGFFSVGPESFVGDLYSKLNAENIVEAGEGAYPSLTQEAIIDRDPEVILLADAEFGQTPEVVSARPGWEAIAAVTNGRVYAIDADIYSRPGPRIVDALEELAGLLYPDESSWREAPCSACFAAPA
ncbi:MAG: ABC transporter substrate-binding protein [Dehalococcoidia bacterium]